MSCLNINPALTQIAKITTDPDTFDALQVHIKRRPWYYFYNLNTCYNNFITNHPEVNLSKRFYLAGPGRANLVAELRNYRFAPTNKFIKDYIFPDCSPAELRLFGYLCRLFFSCENDSAFVAEVARLDESTAKAILTSSLLQGPLAKYETRKDALNYVIGKYFKVGTSDKVRVKITTPEHEINIKLA